MRDVLAIVRGRLADGRPIADGDVHDLCDEVERLREALRLADAALSGANMNMRAVEKKVRAALGENGHD